jgi:tRNA pseudouridine38-40 synthase
MPNFKVVLAYDGTDLVGWQRQAAGVSIQGLLEEALRELDERDVAVTGAGRTDAGVHALGQVAAFSIERPLTADAVVRALNARLPDAVRVLSAEETPPSFHARFDARAKSYRYRICNGDVLSPFERRYAWHVPGALDAAAMQAAAQILEGVHDFAAFRSVGSDVRTTEREVYSSQIADCRLQIDGGIVSKGSDAFGGSLESAICNPQSAIISYEITGSGFLRHMVRAIVGSIVEVGRGRHPPEWMAEVLASRDRGRAGQTAPAGGLFLVSVTYGVVESRFTSKEP